jgi:hypothetical protein
MGHLLSLWLHQERLVTYSQVLAESGLATLLSAAEVLAGLTPNSSTTILDLLPVQRI